MFNSEIQTYLAYSLILTFGVLHGANDLLLIRIKSSKKGLKVKFYKALSYYVFTILIILAVFFSYPPLALLLFILLSAYHFGEQHFKKFTDTSKLLNSLLYIFYGLIILFMLFYFNLNEVLLIFQDLTEVQFTKTLFMYTLLLIGFLFLSCLFYLVLRKNLKINIFEELFYLLVLLVVFKTAGLLWGFAIYFILWHSIPSLTDQMKFLYGKASKVEFLKYIKSSWLYWLTSIIGLLSLYLIFKEKTEYLTSILIYFLAAITFPHVIVMSKLEKD
ncbi:Brp/Blh family beta-carotene 15,15'-dioxygenase [Croceitalea sp. MTPC9]|uniref:Brp/Blh family beta-carotene 15,15'-dioxygenase n=1 Tax=unclassified Croceitalea TaxID=2632280 RepID=UPI00403F83F5